MPNLPVSIKKPVETGLVSRIDLPIYTNGYIKNFTTLLTEKNKAAAFRLNKNTDCIFGIKQ
jgi:hypothetical protein